MAQDFSALPDVMDRLARQVEVSATEIARAAASSFQRDVVINTPVDTGRARSNWVGTKNTPWLQEIEPYVPYPSGSGRDKSERANAEAAIEQAESQIRMFDVTKDQSIEITNTVDYLRNLNEGSSSQEPAGFFERAIAVAIGVVRGKTLLRA